MCHEIFLKSGLNFCSVWPNEPLIPSKLDAQLWKRDRATLYTS